MSDPASEVVDELVDALVEAKDCWADSFRNDEYEDARRRVLRLLPAVQMIAEATSYGVDAADFEIADAGWEFAVAYDSALRLQGVLQNATRVRSAIEQTAPRLSAESFHRWVWTPAASLWRDGYTRNAIHAAAAYVETQLQAKLGREDISGVALIREAFTLNEPVEAKPRLRFKWLTPGSEAYRSRHEGALAFGTGVFQLIRNSAAHSPTDLSERVALEHLAALSYLARLIAKASVVGVRPSSNATDDPFT